MSKKTLRYVLCFALLGGASCAQPSRTSSAPAGSAAAPADPKAPVAKIGSEVITEGELAQAAKGQLGKIEAEHAQQVHDTKSQVLNQMIEKRLLEAKAKKEGITVEALEKREIDDKIPAPPDSELQQIYDRTKASGRQLPPFDQVKGDIAKFVNQQKSHGARQAFIDKLKSEAKVETMLAPLMLPKIQVAAEGPSKGADKAPITIVEFSDFQCPFCSRAEETVKKVMESYQGKVRLVYREFPLPFHNNAQKASEAALCAQDQGKYWEMHEKLFQNQQALEVTQLKEHAKGLGLDAGKFDKCLDSGDKAKLVEASKKAGEEAGVSGTPAFFINGTPLSGAQPFEKFKEIIDHELVASSK